MHSAPCCCCVQPEKCYYTMEKMQGKLPRLQPEVCISTAGHGRRSGITCSDRVRAIASGWPISQNLHSRGVKFFMCMDRYKRLRACVHDLKIVRINKQNNMALMDKICNRSIDICVSVVKLLIQNPFLSFFTQHYSNLFFLYLFLYIRRDENVSILLAMNEN